MNFQSIVNLVDICARHGIAQALISPGSRNAPLTIALARNDKIKCRSVSDERSAGFIGLGLALETRKPTILCCTSGSASLNYAPAIAEAYFQQVPLLILTADRPPEWIDQLDGQTIRQHEIYGKHVKKSYALPVDLSDTAAERHAYRIMNEAINIACQSPPGPVHINVPFREPFYPETSQVKAPDPAIKVFTESQPVKESADWSYLKEKWNSYTRKVILGGQNRWDKDVSHTLGILFKKHKIPVIGDVISNLHGIDEVISHADFFLNGNKRGLQESLQPDLLITFGLSTISKNLKLFLREYGPVEHWHIQIAGETPDTYQSLTQVIRTKPRTFFEHLITDSPTEDFSFQKQENYCNIWLIEERKARRFLPEYLNKNPWNEFGVVGSVLQKVNVQTNIHLANSMAVRYANFIGIDNENIEVFANRGTSGIDGCTSTAVGLSLESNKLNMLITGDIAFFYDRNAFWHNYPLANLRVLLINNNGGGIFRMIKGPDQLPELEEFFETKQTLSAKSLAAEFNLDYLNCDKKSKLNNYIQQFLEDDGKGKILEFSGSSQEAHSAIKQLKEQFSNT